MDQEEKRIFIAINMPPESRSALGSELMQCREKFRGLPVGWVREDNLHLTLSFIGDTPNDKISKINEITADVAKEFSEFEIKITGCGGFPDKINPKVIWLGLEDKGILAQIALRLKTKFEAAGFSQDKRDFNAHLTLARVKGPLSDNEINSIYHLLGDFPEISFGAESLEVMEGTMGREGPEYKILESQRLKPKS